MMNKIFEQEIGDMFEVYMNDIIFKYSEEKLHEGYLTSVLNRLWLYNMKHNFKKYILGIKDKKILRFYLSKGGLKPTQTKIGA